LGFSVSFAPSRSGTGHARHGGDRPSTTCSYVSGISQTSSTSSLTTCDLVSQFRSFPAPVIAMTGAAVLGLSRELRTQPARNRPRTSRRGQVEHKPVAMSPASARPPRLAHSPRATSCRNNAHRPHQGVANARPLHALPSPIPEPGYATRLHVHRRDRLGGILHDGVPRGFRTVHPLEWMSGKVK
jgi:hypothetical protein